MEVWRGDDRFPHRLRGGVVTVGAFDGFHRGHAALLDLVVSTARQRAVPSVVATFDRHPASIVRPDTAPRLLTTLAQRLELIAGAGVDVTRVMRFDEETSLVGAGDFVRSRLIDDVGASAVVTGENFHFGLRRRGTVPALGEIADAFGLGLVVVPLVTDATERPISSAMVRTALAEGDVVRAAELLGRPHEVRGVVETGDQRGRTLGFPTANVAVPGDIMLPADGVYAGWYLTPDGARHPTAVSVGRRPTFYEENGLLLVEAFLLDFEGDLYGQAASVCCTDWIRGQERFESADALVDQMRRDVRAVRQALHGRGFPSGT